MRLNLDQIELAPSLIGSDRGRAAFSRKWSRLNNGGDIVHMPQGKDKHKGHCCVGPGVYSRELDFESPFLSPLPSDFRFARIVSFSLQPPRLRSKIARKLAAR